MIVNMCHTFGTIVLVISAILVIIFDPYKQLFKKISNHFTVCVLISACVSAAISDITINVTIYFYVILALISLLNIFYIVTTILLGYKSQRITISVLCHLQFFE